MSRIYNKLSAGNAVTTCRIILPQRQDKSQRFCGKILRAGYFRRVYYFMRRETFAHFFVLRVFRNDVWCPFNPVFTNELLLLQSSPHCVVRFGGRMGKLRRAMPSVRFRPFPLLPRRQIYLFLRRLAKGVNYDRNETLQEKSYLQRQKHG